jgi:chemotaxis protein histidine kinase CheA
MNRLQELARRQEDLNERLKELQASLQEAKSEQEREEIKRRLKRLQEEQQQMLADVDEVRQRMDKPENQSRMADEKQQLDKTRDDIQKAADAAAQGSVAQALASGTRAQRQLQQLREEMRKQNSSQFAEDLRDMRQEARDLAREQEKLSQQLDALGGPQQRKSLADSTDRKELQEGLAQQKERMNKFTERAQQISEQAENAEPLLSRQLYDSVRKLSQDDANAVKETKQELLREGLMTRELLDRLQKNVEREAGGKTLDLATDMLREGYLPQAGQAGRRARAATEELKRGVERAADSVLGDDAEQLKLAQSELDKLTDELTREIAQAQGQGKPGQSGAPRAGDPTQRQAGTQPGGERAPGEAGAPGEGEQPGQEPGQGGQQPGQKPGQSGRGVATAGQPGNQPGQGGQPGQTPGQGQGQGQQAGAGQPGQTGEGQTAGEGAGGPGQPGRQANRLAGGRDGRNPPRAGGERGGLDVSNILNGGANDGGDERIGLGGDMGGMYRGGPFVGGNFAPWNERLRDVEQLLDSPDLRNAVATARERARLLRRDIVNDRKKPDWAVVKLQILNPLVEVRARVAEALSRRDSKESLAPIDRDPVPARFAESVRRYYEELGKDKDKPDTR